jgi:hypothetical protein
MTSLPNSPPCDTSGIPHMCPHSMSEHRTAHASWLLHGLSDMDRPASSCAVTILVPIFGSLVCFGAAAAAGAPLVANARHPCCLGGGITFRAKHQPGILFGERNNSPKIRIWVACSRRGQTNGPWMIFLKKGGLGLKIFPCSGFSERTIEMKARAGECACRGAQANVHAGR